VSEPAEKKRVVVSGASGFLGKAIVTHLRDAGYDVLRLVRGAAVGDGESSWDATSGTIDKAALQGAHAFINLSGESIGGSRWSEKTKREILQSRTRSTGLLAETIASMSPKPACFLCASAIGFYGPDRGEEELTELSSQGRGFLADVCSAWEDATLPAKNAGVRTANLRFGVILGKDGGALAKMLPVFRLGLGARIGNGRQIMSWIGLHDAARAVLYVLENKDIDGPVNVVAPRPVTNSEFTDRLAKALGKGTGVPVPAFVLKTALGEMAKETILSSQRAVPQKLTDAGFEFSHSGLLGALKNELGGSETPTSSSDRR